MATSKTIDLPRWHSTIGVTAAAVILTLVAPGGASLEAQTSGEPYAALVPASTLSFPNETDSNSPAVWEVVDGA